jgi:hypothetical protein
MSTRAVIGRSMGDGRWRGVWNHNDGHTDQLGQALIDRVAELHGDLAAAVRVIIDEMPDGWSSFYLDNKGEEGGTWTGTCRGETAAFDGELPDAHYLYLFDVTDRRLRVFEVDDGPCVAFTSCAFDAEGRAMPEHLEPTLDDGHDDDGEAEPDVEPGPSPEQLLEAAARALGARSFEAVADEDTARVELHLVVRAALAPRSRDEINLAELRRHGIEADDGDELLFPVYYRRDDIGLASDQRRTGLATLLGLPEDTIASMQGALAAHASG